MQRIVRILGEYAGDLRYGDALDEDAARKVADEIAALEDFQSREPLSRLMARTPA